MPEELVLVLEVVLAGLGAILFGFWASLVIWTFRDIRARSRDIFAQFFATLLVLLFNLPGLFIYLILRPRETLVEVYERELEAEALLQDIEERQSCPACKARLQPDFQFCPACHTRVKKRCPECDRSLRLEWNICPYCGTAV